MEKGRSLKEQDKFYSYLDGRLAGHDYVDVIIEKYGPQVKYSTNLSCRNMIYASAYEKNWIGYIRGYVDAIKSRTS